MSLHNSSPFYTTPIREVTSVSWLWIPMQPSPASFELSYWSSQPPFWNGLASDLAQGLEDSRLLGTRIDKWTYEEMSKEQGE